MDPARVRAAQRDLYEAGDYFALSDSLRPAAEELVARAGVGAGDRVLDVGAGDGNVALAAAELGAEVVALDLSHLQLVRARARQAELRCVAGDAARLPFRDCSFDAVLSAFGAVFAPEPGLMADELFRACRPGGVVGLTAWPPDSLLGELTDALRSASPDPAAFPDQELHWGEEETARNRFAVHSSEVETHRLSLLMDPAIRGAAGPADCAGRFMAEHLVGVDLAALRNGVLPRHLNDDGEPVYDYLLVLGRR
jgi:2-polyprenyl-6-hydroxyphenyl methylase/3-demethylubiquinone-9 3-methyltransferase